MSTEITVIGDNVSMNNCSVVLSPHTIQMDNSVALLSVHMVDRESLLPKSGIYGGTRLADVLLGSHCRPFRGQMVAGGGEYNDKPMYCFCQGESTR